MEPAWDAGNRNCLVAGKQGQGWGRGRGSAVFGSAVAGAVEVEAVHCSEILWRR